MSVFTEAQYQTLVQAIADGALTVKYQDKLVTYRSLDEMLKIKKMMEDDLGLNAAGKGPFRTIAVHDKQL